MKFMYWYVYPDVLPAANALGVVNVKVTLVYRRGRGEGGYHPLKVYFKTLNSTIK